MRLNRNEIKQERCHYITMGRGRKGVIEQGKKNKSGDLLPSEDRKFFWSGIKKLANQTPVYYLSEEFLNSFRQMNPCDVANILVNTQARKI